LLRSTGFSLCITIAICIILFLDDLKTIFSPKNYDIIFNILEISIWIFFWIEFLLFSIFIKSYLFSFFFFLDIITISSLIPEIDFIYHANDSHVQYETVHENPYFNINLIDFCTFTSVVLILPRRVELQ